MKMMNDTKSICYLTTILRGPRDHVSGSMEVIFGGHLPLLYRCGCGRITVLCKLCGQVLREEGPASLTGRWASVRPWRLHFVFIGDTDQGRFLGQLWRPRDAETVIPRPSFEADDALGVPASWRTKHHD
jgi:hypothetical protein